MSGLHQESSVGEVQNYQRLRQIVAFLVGLSCGILSGAAVWLILNSQLPQGDPDRHAEDFWHGVAFFAAMGGALGLGSGYLAALLVKRRIVVWQIGVVFLSVALLMALASRNPNVGVVAGNLACLTLVQPLFCLLSGLGLRSTKDVWRNRTRTPS